ncbi:MAG: DUF5688 family protein [Eubacteriales bacterium]|nr:DUF5688 family protein [Eubacteriales bacterium]
MNMTYEAFLNGLEQSMKAKSTQEEHIRRVQVLKNNGVRLDGFACRTEGHREQPTVYVNQFYREEIGGEELEELAESVLKLQRDNLLSGTEDFESLMDYRRVKRRIYYRLVSREKNRELLAGVPWIPWMDLALVFYMKLPGKIVRRATALIHRSHMEKWGLTAAELYRTAHENMPDLGVKLIAMSEFLGQEESECPESGMYILNSRQGEYGAAVFADPRVQRRCAMELGGSYYVLPSSVHEMILLPERTGLDRQELDSLVREVNALCVGPEDLLSDHAYFYHAGDGVVNF